MAENGQVALEPLTRKYSLKQCMMLLNRFCCHLGLVLFLPVFKPSLASLPSAALFCCCFRQAPGITVCDGGCEEADGVAFLSDSFELSWEVRDMSCCCYWWW